MIDFHSHVLPKMDDGSHSTDESLEMLSCLDRQGISTVAATSHFYPTRESLSEFLENREASYEHLCRRLPEGAPEILLGAETLYYTGCSRMQGLEKLRIQGTRLLLLEMPAGTWSDYMIQELIDMSCSDEWTLLLAHIERYLPMQKKKTWDTLLGCGVLMQSNAGFFIERSTRRKAVRMLQEERIHLLGTDCHNMTSRPPRMGEAIENIRKYGGAGCLRKLMERSISCREEHSAAQEMSFKAIFR